jgi:hypothetical protein
MLVKQEAVDAVKILKTIPLVAYAQAHKGIWCVLLALQLPYDEPHAPYDQTHGPYAEAHA